MRKLLFVSIDAYRKDNLEKKYSGIPCSPFLTKIMHEGFFYSNYMASCNWTIPSYASMFTGEPTVRHNYWSFKQYPQKPAELIFDRLSKAGVGSSLIYTGGSLDKKIFKYDTKNYFSIQLNNIDIDKIIETVVRCLKKGDFVFLHTFMQHNYIFHQKYKTKKYNIKRDYQFIGKEQSQTLSKKIRRWLDTNHSFQLNADDIKNMEKMYYNECLLVDSFIELLFSIVFDVFPDLEVIINADHGDCFGQCKKKLRDPKNWHLSKHTMFGHGSGLCYEQFEVFAIEYGGRINGGQINNTLMDHQDIYKMILRKFDTNYYKPQSKRRWWQKFSLNMQQDSAAEDIRDVAHLESTDVDKTYNIISTGYNRVGLCGILKEGTFHIYDMTKDFEFLYKDNLYTDDVSPPKQDDIENYRRILRSHAKQIDSSESADEEVMKKLKGLGYV